MECREIEVRYVKGANLKFDGRKPLTTSTDVAAMLRPLLENNTRESFIAVYLDGRLRPIGYVRTDGQVAFVPVRPADLLGTAFLCASKAMVVVHNHPSGDTSPSAEDKMLTKRLREAGSLLGVDLLDHVIIGADGAYFSFCDSGLLERLAASTATRRTMVPVSNCAQSVSPHSPTCCSGSRSFQQARRRKDRSARSAGTTTQIRSTSSRM
jgi:DNA repair protein RadC